MINTVGAISLCATLNCDEFASAHSSTAHFDRESFVGLAWRPTGESICCGVQPLCSFSAGTLTDCGYDQALRLLCMLQRSTRQGAVKKPDKSGRNPQSL